MYSTYKIFKNVYNSIHVTYTFFLKNIQNSIYLTYTVKYIKHLLFWRNLHYFDNLEYTIFRRIYTIPYIQHIQFLRM